MALEITQRRICTVLAWVVIRSRCSMGLIPLADRVLRNEPQVHDGSGAYRGYRGFEAAASHLPFYLEQSLDAPETELVSRA